MTASRYTSALRAIMRAARYTSAKRRCPEGAMNIWGVFVRCRRRELHDGRHKWWGVNLESHEW